MKRLIICMLAALAALTMSAFALEEGDWKYRVVDNKAVLIEYKGQDTEMVFPEQVGGYDVVSASPELFKGHKSLISIVIPAEFGVVPDGLCNGVPYLKSVVIEEGITKIGTGAFQNCPSLVDVQFPSTIEVFSDHAFQGCSNLSFDIPSTVKEIGILALSGTHLSDVVVNAETFGKGAFQTCNNLRSIKFTNENCKTISESMFYDCPLLETVEFPSAVELIDYYAFDGCVKLRDLRLPKGLKSIKKKAFNECQSLVNVVIPYGTLSLGNAYAGEVFTGCTALRRVFVPSTVESIGVKMLSEKNDCVVYCTAGSKMEEYCSNNGFSYSSDITVDSSVRVYYNGTPISFNTYGQNPEIVDGRTLVPLRSIFEAMGVEVEWDNDTRTAVASRDGLTIKIQIGSDKMYKNNEAVPVDVPAQIINGRTMVPVRVISEALGADVVWDGSSNSALITE